MKIINRAIELKLSKEEVNTLLKAYDILDAITDTNAKYRDIIKTLTVYNDEIGEEFIDICGKAYDALSELTYLIKTYDLIES